ncbi:hypothetical protein GCM10010415_57580 [Streptomyces atrovirens]|uniref:DUF6461 domain-containing protein n=1 Tax=Streptomyces atrovirens TaxID=285556 RepID=A0ABW0DU74_9ACTN
MVLESSPRGGDRVHHIGWHCPAGGSVTPSEACCTRLRSGRSGRVETVLWSWCEGEVKSLTAAKFALAHHVTGVRLTRRLLETAEFTRGLVTKRPATSWLRA